MVKVNFSVSSRKRRRKILKRAKGFTGARSKLYTVAKNAVERSLYYSYIHRKKRKNMFRKLWIIRINAICRIYNTNYSTFIYKLRMSNIFINKKLLSNMLINNHKLFINLLNKL